MSQENEQIASEIAARIAKLELTFDQPLKDELSALKLAILENPSACLLLKDEDVGSLVKALMRTVSAAAQLAAEEKPARKTAAKPKTKALSAAELEAQLAAEGF